MAVTIDLHSPARTWKQPYHSVPLNVAPGTTQPRPQDAITERKELLLDRHQPARSDCNGVSEARRGLVALVGRVA